MFHIQMQLIRRLDQWNEYVCMYVCMYVYRYVFTPSLMVYKYIYNIL